MTDKAAAADEAISKLDAAHKQKAKADRHVRWYNSIVVTVTCIIVAASFVIDLINATAAREQIIECITPGTRCAMRIEAQRAAAGAESTEDLVDRIIEDINANTDRDFKEIQNKLVRVLEILEG